MSLNRRRDPTRTEQDDGAFLDPTAVSSSCQSVDRSVAVDEVQTQVNDPGAQLRETMLRAYIDFLLSEDIQCSIRAGTKRTREQLNALFRREWKKIHGSSIDEDRVLESLFPLVSVAVPVDHSGRNAASEPDLASQAEASKSTVSRTTATRPTTRNMRRTENETKQSTTALISPQLNHWHINQPRFSGPAPHSPSSARSARSGQRSTQSPSLSRNGPPPARSLRSTHRPSNFYQGMERQANFRQRGR